MNNIFDINTLLCENTLADELLAKSFPSETYIFSAIKSMRSFNENLLHFNKELYKSLNEASSKEQENLIFGDFYNKYSHILDKYINEISTMTGRFYITLDNLVDSNMALINDQDVLGCTTPIVYTATKYKNLCSGDKPKFDPLSIYQEEFNYIGQLMQDLGPISTDIAKLEVIASVSNQFNNKMKNKWVEKCIENITGEDDCKDLSCYAEVVTKIFIDKDEEEMNINKGIIYAMREEVSGYEKYKDRINKIADKLVTDFEYISKNIGSMFYRNKDKVLSIRSKDDSVLDRDYQLNTYAMNQLDIFMKGKVNQITQLCSLYVIALSIMMDSIMNHITQCVDILDKVKDSCTDYEVQDTIEPENDDIPDDGESSGDESDDDINNIDDFTRNGDEDSSSDGDEFDLGDLDNDEEPIDEEPEEPDLESGNEIEPPEEEPIEVEESSKEFENEECMFEYSMYIVENMMNNEELIDYVLSTVLREADNVAGADAQKAVDNANIIEKIVMAFQQLYDKFQGIFQKQTSKMSEFMKKNSNVFSECDFNKGEGFKVTKYNMDSLNNLSVVPLNYQAMKQDLTDEKTFIDKNYANISSAMNTNNSTMKEAISSMVIPKGDAMETITSGNYSDKLKYLANFNDTFAKIKDDADDIRNASAVARTLSKQLYANKSENNNSTTTNQQQTSTATKTKADVAAGGAADAAKAAASQAQNASYITTADMYFNEDTEIPKVKGEANNANDVKSQLRIYFKVMTTLTCAKMSLSQKIFNDYFKVLNSVLKLNGKPYYGNKEKDNK